MPYKPPASAGECGILAKGDVLTDYSAAIKAIGAGRRAAASMHHIMYGISPSLPQNVITPRSALQNVDCVDNVRSASRRIMPLCDVRDLDQCAQLEKGFDEEMARDEASRCLQCGLICYEKDEGLLAVEEEASAA